MSTSQAYNPTIKEGSEIDDFFEESSKPLPPMNDLKDQALTISEKLGELTKEIDEDDDLDDLVALEQKELQAQVPETSQKTPTQSKPPPSELTSRQGYQESFTSQQESAEIRHQLDSFSTRLSHMEELIESLLQERSQIPKHLDRLRKDTNDQMTIVMDRLHTALEHVADSSALAQSKQDVEVLTAESAEVLGQLSSDLQRDPSQTSKAAQKTPISKGRRRVHVIE